ncbi:hypothetical protein V1522DRAFT_357056, partial [Lipomyces starkeyi]
AITDAQRNSLRDWYQSPRPSQNAHTDWFKENTTNESSQSTFSEFLSNLLEILISLHFL